MNTKTLILESGNCSHSGCIFCGYCRERTQMLPAQILKARIDQLLLDPPEELKIFASGSFLDNNQFPSDFRQHLAEKCRTKNIKLVFESRPEFITKDTLNDFKGVDLTVAIGLEVADNAILSKINKGFTKEDFAEAAETLHANGFKVRAYLIANLPFIKDIKTSLHDSVKYAKKYSDSIIVINLIPHSKAPLLDLWLKGEWHPLSKKAFHELTQGLNVDLDEETFRFVPSFPNKKKKFWTGVGGELLENDHYRVWQEYLTNWYETPENKDRALFLPCSYKKPYSHSQTHTLIFHVLKKVSGSKRIHRIVISSPGVIPFEFNNRYPFTAYDWDEKLETPEIKKEYIRVNKARVKAYLETHNYKKVLCFYKPSSESYQALKQACEELSIPLKNILTKNTPLHSTEALEQLEQAISSVCS